jgi:hypothetical protein
MYMNKQGVEGGGLGVFRNLSFPTSPAFARGRRMTAFDPCGKGGGLCRTVSRVNHPCYRRGFRNVERRRHLPRDRSQGCEN